MDAQKLLLSTCSGLLAGVAIGMLVAPASGKETRYKIVHSTDELKERLSHLRKKAGLKVDELRKMVETQVEGLSEEARERILELIESGRTAANTFADRMEENVNKRF
jgi:gas vesicle protein